MDRASKRISRPPGACASDNTTASSAPEGSRLALRPREAAKAIGIGQRKLWELTNRGEIPHARLGRAIVYPVAALNAWLVERAKESI